MVYVFNCSTCVIDDCRLTKMICANIYCSKQVPDERTYYCSYKCARQHRLFYLQNYKQDILNRTCLTCGIQYVQYDSFIKTKYCSKKCRYKYHRDKQTMSDDAFVKKYIKH